MFLLLYSRTLFWIIQTPINHVRSNCVVGVIYFFSARPRLPLFALDRALVPCEEEGCSFIENVAGFLFSAGVWRSLQTHEDTAADIHHLTTMAML